MGKLEDEAARVSRIPDDVPISQETVNTTATGPDVTVAIPDGTAYIVLVQRTNTGQVFYNFSILTAPLITDGLFLPAQATTFLDVKAGQIRLVSDTDGEVVTIMIVPG